MTTSSDPSESSAADDPTPPAGAGLPDMGRQRVSGWGGLLWAVVVVAALVLGIGVGQVFLRSRSGAHDATPARAPAGPVRTVRPSPTGNAQAQAQGVNALLASGKQAHERLRYNAGTCDGLAAAVPAFERIVRDREQEWASAQKLPVDRLPQAAEPSKTLTETYQYSTEADRAYLAWARAAEEQDCGDAPPPDTSDLADARAADDKAAPAKRRPAGLWNPLARSRGLPTYGWRDL